MTVTALHASERNPMLTAALTVAVGGAATILGAYFFQYVVGLNPCPLCLEQRIPYYVAIPFAGLVAAAAYARWDERLIRVGLGLLVIALLIGAGLGVYHSGVEWKFWPGPQDCSGQISGLGSVSDLMSRLETIRVVRCDEAAWRFLGLSLAGYNVLISLALAAVAGWGMLAGRRA